MGLSLLQLCIFVAYAMAGDDTDRGVFAILRSIAFSGSGTPGTPKQPVPMKIIGAGLGRTGTSSLLAGLKQLGYTPYHMKEGVMDMGHQAQWARLVDAFVAGDVTNQKRATDALIDLMASTGFDATTDYPTCLIFEALMHRYPDAKVILSTRSSGKSWAKSVLSTIGRMDSAIERRPFTFSSHMRDMIKVGRGIWSMTPGVTQDPVTGALDEASLIRSFDLWDEHVRAVVPPERLLVHTSSDGFAPICKLLGISDCPSEYPNINDAASMQRGMMVMQIISWIWLPVVLGAVLLLGCCVCCCFSIGVGKAKGKDE